MTWKHCSIHGESNTDRAWACPDCMAEARTENKRLKAEVEQLRADLDLIFRVAGQYWVTKNALDKLEAENQRLKAKLGRRRK